MLKLFSGNSLNTEARLYIFDVYVFVQTDI